MNDPRQYRGFSQNANAVDYKREVLIFLQGGRGLTAMEALERKMGARLAATIFDLKKDGHDIVTEKISVDTARKPVKVAKYWLRQFAPWLRAEPAHLECSRCGWKVRVTPRLFAEVIKPLCVACGGDMERAA